MGQPREFRYIDKVDWEGECVDAIGRGIIGLSSEKVALARDHYVEHLSDDEILAKYSECRVPESKSDNLSPVGVALRYNMQRVCDDVREQMTAVWGNLYEEYNNKEEPAFHALCCIDELSKSGRFDDIDSTIEDYDVKQIVTSVVESFNKKSYLRDNPVWNNDTRTIANLSASEREAVEKTVEWHCDNLKQAVEDALLKECTNRMFESFKYSDKPDPIIGAITSERSLDKFVRGHADEIFSDIISHDLLEPGSMPFMLKSEEDEAMRGAREYAISQGHGKRTWGVPADFIAASLKFCENGFEGCEPIECSEDVTALRNGTFDGDFNKLCSDAVNEFVGELSANAGIDALSDMAREGGTLNFREILRDNPEALLDKHKVLTGWDASKPATCLFSGAYNGDTLKFGDQIKSAVDDTIIPICGYGANPTDFYHSNEYADRAIDEIFEKIEDRAAHVVSNAAVALDLGPDILAVSRNIEAYLADNPDAKDQIMSALGAPVIEKSASLKQLDKALQDVDNADDNIDNNNDSQYDE